MGKLPTYRDSNFRASSRPAWRADGQFRGRPSESRGGAGGLSGVHPNRALDPYGLVLFQPDPDGCGRSGGGQRERRAHPRAAVTRRCPQSRRTHSCHGQARGRARRPGCLRSRIPGWPRHAAEERGALAEGDGCGVRRARFGSHRHPDRPLLRHGPRPPLGQDQAGLRPDHPGQGRPLFGNRGRGPAQGLRAR